MADYTYEELHKMTVAQLREICEGLEDQEAVQGFSQLHKEHVLPLLCKALGIEAHEHHEVVGINKAKIKAEIRQLKKERDQVLQTGQKGELKSIRRKIRGLKRTIRQATV